MLRIAGQDLDPSLIVFDKNDTLVTVGDVWHAWFYAWQTALAKRVTIDAPLRQAIAETVGMDVASGAWDPVGPLTLASTSEVGLLLAGLLYRYRNLPWDEALAVVHSTQGAARGHLGALDLVQPIGDVCGLLQRLRDAGLRIGLITTDDRFSTEESLTRLGLASLIDVMICGNDGLPLKPAPEPALEVCRLLGVAPSAAIMVGDSITDMSMARRAGFAYAVGVTTGALSVEALALHADLLIPSIHSIQVVPDGDGEGTERE